MVTRGRIGNDGGPVLFNTDDDNGNTPEASVMKIVEFHSVAGKIL